jgi:aminocarboxymuconate-semialdehyde decarboxylase
MTTIDLDSHSRPRPEDYKIEADYSHLIPRSYSDARGTIRHVFNNRILSVSTAGELEIATKDSGWGGWGPNYDGNIGAAFCRAANDFVYRTFMKPYPRTFTGLAKLPLQDIAESTKELERCVKDLGMPTFLMPTNTNGIDMADAHWWNFYHRVRELGITGIVVHFGTLHGAWVGKERLGVLGPDGTTGRRILSGPFEYCTNIVNLIFGGLMDVFPEFRFAFMELGARFAVDLKDRIEENLEQIGYLREMIAHPLDWYFERFYFLVDDRMLEKNGKLLRDAIEELGVDHLFLGSDYPHPDGHLNTFVRLKELTWLSDEVKEKILAKNVERFIGKSLVDRNI